jgi:hypothetical protein
VGGREWDNVVRIYEWDKFVGGRERDRIGEAVSWI